VPATRRCRRLLSVVILPAVVRCHKDLRLITVCHSFNTHFVSYVFQFICVSFAVRRRRLIAVEC